MSDEEFVEMSPEPEEENLEDSTVSWAASPGLNHLLQLLNLSVDALRHVHRDAQEENKFTEIGAKYNMCFKMLKSDSRLVKSVFFSYGFIQVVVIFYSTPFRF